MAAHDLERDRAGRREAGAAGTRLPRAVVVALAAAASWAAEPALATELSSAGYRHRAGNFASGATTQLSGAGPRFGGSGISAGPPAAAGFSGAVSDLTTAAAGFWPVVAGALPNLDVDGDGIPSYEDGDDDGDGLSDAVETGTGTFVSASDTGTSPVSADSDGDGIGDGDEVAAGTDPTDPLSFPEAVPGLSWPWLAALASVLVGVARPRRRATPSRSE